MKCGKFLDEQRWVKAPFKGGDKAEEGKEI